MVLILALTTVVSSSHLVQAQAACSVQVSSQPSASSQYSPTYNGNSSYIQLTVPLSAYCGYSTGQLYAVGNAYDMVTNAMVGYATTAMNPVNDYYSTQMIFNLPPSIIEHPLQMIVSVYDNSYNNGMYNYGGYAYYNGMMATTDFTVTVHSSYQMGYNQNGYSNNYPYYPPGYYNGQCYYDYQYVYMYYYNGNYYYGNCYYGQP